MLKINEYEAEIVAQLAHCLCNHLLDQHGNELTDPDFIQNGLGIITPHNAQINAIRNALLAHQVPVNRFPIIDTVDRFQGQEREVVIISYGVSDYDFALAEVDFILSPNRFNVSITRPKGKYIIIMNENLINILPEDEQMLEWALELKEFQQHFENEQSVNFSLWDNDIQLDLRMFY